MDKISNDNAIGLCAEKTCNEEHTHFVTVLLWGVNTVICYCEKHANIYEAFEWLKDHPIKEKCPTILCKKTKDGLEFFCDFCGENHRHGNGDGDRAAHCTNPNSPYIKTGYILKEENK